MKRLIREIIINAAKTFAVNKLPPVLINEPPPGEIGDVSSSVAFALAKTLKKSPKEVAQELAKIIKKEKIVKNVFVGGSGFLNITLEDDLLIQQIGRILTQGKDYGRSSINKGKKARVEFVSANPTGPLHIGNARGGPLGDTIASLLEAVGYKVLREYIDNNRGNQIKELGASLVGEGNQYQGEYLKELRSKISKISEINAEKAGKEAVEILLKEIMTDCKAMGISFDHIVHEDELQKEIPDVLKDLESKKVLKKHDGATWFSPKDEFLKDKDAVVVKSDGSYLYFTADIIYHKEKFTSGYDLVIDVFGSNTAGHVPKLQALAKIYEFDINKFKVLLYQFVRVKRGSEVIKMSKRAGDFVTAREVLDEVGKDAFRFMMLLHDPNTHIDFDLELAKKQSQENPVYYVQYAAVRCKSILKKSQLTVNNYQSSIEAPEERHLALQLLKLPDLVEELSQTLRVHQLTQYAIDTARVFHDFYEKMPVIQEGKINESRLALVEATLVTLENTLQLLGMTIPEKM